MCYQNRTTLSAIDRFRTRDEARRAIFEYIEVWYNRRRRHSSLGYITPEQAREKFNGETKIAA